eukprot:s6284_g3.t1
MGVHVVTSASSTFVSQTYRAFVFTKAKPRCRPGSDEVGRASRSAACRSARPSQWCAQHQKSAVLRYQAGVPTMRSGRELWTALYCGWPSSARTPGTMNPRIAPQTLGSEAGMPRPAASCETLCVFNRRDAAEKTVVLGAFQQQLPVDDGIGTEGSATVELYALSSWSYGHDTEASHTCSFRVCGEAGARTPT